MNNKILIFGTGFIGNRLKDELDCSVSEKRIYSYKDAEDEIKKFNPQIIINCIGHAGRNVDECECDLDKTLMANTFIPVILSEAAIRNNLKFIHISSGCIYHYDYNKNIPIAEGEIPDFFELFYSRSKIYSERALEALSRKYALLIIRIRVPLDSKPHPRNLLDKLISYKKVIDIPNSVTYIPDFLKVARHLIDIQAQGIYNVVNKGALRYCELLDAYRKYVPDFEYRIIDYKTLNLIRTNLILSTDKLEKSGFKMRDIHEVLEECVQDYLKY